MCCDTFLFCSCSPHVKYIILQLYAMLVLLRIEKEQIPIPFHAEMLETIESPFTDSSNEITKFWRHILHYNIKRDTTRENVGFLSYGMLL